MDFYTNHLPSQDLKSDLLKEGEKTTLKSHKTAYQSLGHLPGHTQYHKINVSVETFKLLKGSVEKKIKFTWIEGFLTLFDSRVKTLFPE